MCHISRNSTKAKDQDNSVTFPKNTTLYTTFREDNGKSVAVHSFEPPENISTQKQNPHVDDNGKALLQHDFQFG